jgi:hypothetical protein
MGTAASVVCLLMVVGVTCSCIIRRTRTITPRGTRRRAQWIYWVPPRIFLTLHEYQRAMEAKTVGEGIIERRNSTYQKLPLCQVLKFWYHIDDDRQNKASKFILINVLTAVCGFIVSTDRFDKPESNYIAYKIIWFVEPINVRLVKIPLSNVNHFTCLSVVVRSR